MAVTVYAELLSELPTLSAGYPGNHQFDKSKIRCNIRQQAVRCQMLLPLNAAPRAVYPDISPRYSTAILSFKGLPELLVGLKNVPQRGPWRQGHVRRGAVLPCYVCEFEDHDA